MAVTAQLYIPLDFAQYLLHTQRLFYNHSHDNSFRPCKPHSIWHNPCLEFAQLGAFLCHWPSRDHYDHSLGGGLSWFPWWLDQPCNPSLTDLHEQFCFADLMWTCTAAAGFLAADQRADYLCLWDKEAGDQPWCQQKGRTGSAGEARHSPINSVTSHPWLCTYLWIKGVLKGDFSNYLSYSRLNQHMAK